MIDLVDFVTGADELVESLSRVSHAGSQGLGRDVTSRARTMIIWGSPQALSSSCSVAGGYEFD